VLTPSAGSSALGLWTRDLQRRLLRELSALEGDRISIPFACECPDESGVSVRASGVENWEIGADGIVRCLRRGSDTRSCAGASVAAERTPEDSATRGIVLDP
jgi:nuclear transport factor 2 (NTF2) superfamily protein